ncbi:hypothetical protein ASC68_12445 [Devosia sp. Root105]|nr:hypothetical protein ASC68_12445 [Devosia sp. Root105]
MPPSRCTSASIEEIAPDTPAGDSSSRLTRAGSSNGRSPTSSRPSVTSAMVLIPCRNCRMPVEKHGASSVRLLRSPIHSK